MTYESTTTLRDIRPFMTRGDFHHLLRAIGKKRSDGKPLKISTIVDVLGFYQALWLIGDAMQDSRLARHFRAGCAGRLLRFFEGAYPEDISIRHQIALTLKDDATQFERELGYVAAWEAHSKASGKAALAAYAAATCSPLRAARVERDASDDWGAVRATQERIFRAMIGGE